MVGVLDARGLDESVDDDAIGLASEQRLCGHHRGLALANRVVHKLVEAHHATQRQASPVHPGPPAFLVNHLHRRLVTGGRAVLRRVRIVGRRRLVPPRCCRRCRSGTCRARTLTAIVGIVGVGAVRLVPVTAGKPGSNLNLGIADGVVKVDAKGRGVGIKDKAKDLQS